MTRVCIISPTISDSATALSTALLAEGISTHRRRLNRASTYPRFAYTKIINWGSSSHELLSRTNAQLPRGSILNIPSSVNNASSKSRALEIWQRDGSINIPRFTRSRQVASRWLHDELDAVVYCRTILRGHSGEGIVVARNEGQLVDAPLYTRGINIHHEFRFHVINGVVIDGVRKAFDPEVPESERNMDVRNHSTGTIFVRSGPALVEAAGNQELLAMAGRAVTSLGLDFGAVDVIKDRDGTFYVIEVNTACGLTGTTLERYTRAFQELLTDQPITPWNLTEFSGTQTTETTPQTTGTRMNISDCTVGQTIVFNPTASNNIATLTRGNAYRIERLSLTTVMIRNDRNVLKAYQVSHFEEVPVVVIPTGPADGSINTSVPTDSPNRIVRLADGTSVNVSGTVNFIGTSQHIPQAEYTVGDIRRGVDTGDIFIGILHEDVIYRFIVTSFEQGTVAGYTAAPVPVDHNVLQDINSTAVGVGANIQVRVSAGGHGLPVGTLAVVTSINSRDRALVIEVEGREGTIRIHPQRVAKLTPRQLTEAQAEQETLATQGTTSFTIGTNNYRVPSNDVAIIREMLLRFTV